MAWHVCAGAGEYATKFALILLICCIALYRCRHECPSDLFLEIEEQVYKIKKYLLLTAATGATTSLAVAALLTPFSIPLEPPPPVTAPNKQTSSGGTSNVTSSVTSGVTGPQAQDSTSPTGEGSTSEDRGPPNAASTARAGDSQSVEPRGSASSGAHSSAASSRDSDSVTPPTGGSSRGTPDGSTTGQAAGGGADGVEPAPGQTGRNSGPVEEKEAFRWSCLLGTLTNGVAEALGLDSVLDRQPYRTAALTVLLVNVVVMPLIVVYVLWPLWIPQLPALRLFIKWPLLLTGRSGF